MEPHFSGPILVSVTMLRTLKQYAKLSPHFKKSAQNRSLFSGTIYPAILHTVSVTSVL